MPLRDLLSACDPLSLILSVVGAVAGVVVTTAGMTMPVMMGAGVMAGVGEVGKVFVVFQNEAAGLFHCFGCQRTDTKCFQSRYPIECLGDGGLFQNCVIFAQIVNCLCDLNGEMFVDMGKLGANDGNFLFDIGILQIQICAAL